MALYDCYRIRFNTGTGILEMNTGNETWVPVPTIPSDPLVLGALTLNGSTGTIDMATDDGASIAVRPADVDGWTLGCTPGATQTNFRFFSSALSANALALSIDGMLIPATLSDDPAAPVEGAIWYRSDTHEWRGFDGTDSGTFTFTAD